MNRPFMHTSGRFDTTGNRDRVPPLRAPDDPGTPTTEPLVPKRGPPITLERVRPLVRRNQPCAFCTSGRKFKFCCGRHVGPIPVRAVVR